MSQILDYDNLSMLKEVIGDDLKSILESFNEITPTVIEQLEKAITEQNPEQVRHHAHTLKGSAANVGAMALPAIALEMENMGRAGDVSGAAVLFEKIKASYSELTNELNNYISSEF